MAACSLKPYFRGVGKNELINEGHAQRAFRRTVSQSNLKLLSTLPRGGKKDRWYHFRNTFVYFSCKLLF